MKKSKINHEKLWNATCKIADGEKVDLRKFSRNEQNEIKENVGVIKTLKSIPEPVPSKSAFNELLSQIPGQKEIQKKTYDWSAFFQYIFGHQHRWAALPVLGALLLGVFFWGPRQVEVNLILAETENLSQNIQKEFVDVSRELEELRELEKVLTAKNFNASES